MLLLYYMYGRRYAEKIFNGLLIRTYKGDKYGYSKKENVVKQSRLYLFGLIKSNANKNITFVLIKTRISV
jgi:hypothetical protein